MGTTTVLITGATDGIGKATAMELARRGCRVLLHGRSRERCEVVRKAIERSSGRGDIGTFVADFGALQEVRGLASEVSSRVDRLDVLVNNAGVYLRQRATTVDGIEATFQINHVAPFLLTELLLPLLRASAPSRILNVSSVAHQSAHLDLAKLEGNGRWDAYGAYALSKLGNILFTYELAERLAGTGVTANCLHPGVVDTKLLREGFAMGGQRVEEAAQRLAWLALAPELQDVTGKYFVAGQTSRSARQTYDVELRQRFWRVSERLAGLAYASPERD
jgi:NAD(P)-dependent dehydrogenase (short-subunit alcohol dehydrogenase family)